MYTQDYSTFTKQELRNKWQEINYKIRMLLEPYRNRNFLSVSEDELQIFRKKYDEYFCEKREIEMEIRRRMGSRDDYKEPDMAKFGLVISAIYLIFGVVMWLSIM